MRRLLLALPFALIVVVQPVAEAQKPPPREPLAEQVRVSIDRGITFLKNYERGQGHWEVRGEIFRRIKGGTTNLAVLALLTAGVPTSDPVIQRALKTMREQEPLQTYAVALQTIVFAMAGENEDRERIQRNVDWLAEARVMLGGRELQGWSYYQTGAPDNSNTQYALLGLHEGHRAGARVAPEVWKSIHDFYVKTQEKNGALKGGWGYNRREPTPTLTMSSAGLCGLIISGIDLQKAHGPVLPGQLVKGCGEYEANEALDAAIAFMGATFPWDADLNDALARMGRVPNRYYWLYGVERAGRLTGRRFFGPHDWYRAGCEFLVNPRSPGAQKPDGSWGGSGWGDGDPVVATSFALLFLSKGRTPILVSKLAHGPGEDWELHRSDARNLVEFASRELFKKQPMGWQVFDARRVRAETNEQIGLLTADLLQSPIVYISGHKMPEFTGAESEGQNPILRQYIEQGGFIFAEACCGDDRFDVGFRRLLAQLFPDSQLKPLPPEHPVWRASGKWLVVPEPGDGIELYGLDMGCKTVVIYNKGHLGCLWELNEPERGDLGKKGFRLGANIIAYATGMEPPRPRQFELEPIDTDPGGKVPRGYLKVAQIRHEGDWQPAPRAMRTLMGVMEKLGFDVDKQTEAIRPTRPDFYDYRLLYMHGRQAFRFSETERKALRFNLESGGLLLADACCGSKTFDQSFRALVRELWPERKLEPVPAGDELYSRELNGEPITSVRCRREGPDGRPESDFRAVEPALEGIKINGRWVLLYSRYDLGCALEKHQSTDCLGHDHASAVRLGTAVVLYALRR